jgi:hypothetical protein
MRPYLYNFGLSTVTRRPSDAVSTQLLMKRRRSKYVKYIQNRRVAIQIRDLGISILSLGLPVIFATCIQHFFFLFGCLCRCIAVDHKWSRTSQVSFRCALLNTTLRPR